jgi:hypothetical protein
MVALTVGNQAIKAGTTADDTATGILDIYEHKYEHSVTNILLKVTIGDKMDKESYWFSPYVGQQTISGDKVSTALVGSTVHSGITAANALFPQGGIQGVTLSTLKVTTDESRTMAGTFTSAGIVANLGGIGKIAVDTTTYDGKAYGETDVIPALMEFAGATQFNYIAEVTPDASIILFYHSTSTKKDDNLRADIQTMKDNNATLASLGSSSSSLTGYEQLLENYRWSPTTSTGIAFNVKFGN